jgi:hypothetical protein
MTDLTATATTRARWQRAAAAGPPEQYRPVLAKAGSERVERRTLGRDLHVPHRSSADSTFNLLNLFSNFWGMV